LIDQIRGLEEQAQELETRIEETSLRTEDLVKKKDVEIEAVDRKIEEIKKQMKRQAKEFDDMMTTILEKLKEEIRVSTAPKMLLNAGVPIMDDLESVNHEIQSRALE
jgi:KaiC/GvpD/RAD55 family RecA-like ATPase